MLQSAAKVVPWPMRISPMRPAATIRLGNRRATALPPAAIEATSASRVIPKLAISVRTDCIIGDPDGQHTMELWDDL